ncbi:hypothetical protein BH09VER1_BH09VER1_16080 [soil metagenome]
MKALALVVAGLAIFSLVNARADGPATSLLDEFNHDPFANGTDLSYWTTHPWTQPRPYYYAMPYGGVDVWYNVVLHDNTSVTPDGSPPFGYGSISTDAWVMGKILMRNYNWYTISASGNWMVTGTYYMYPYTYYSVAPATTNANTTYPYEGHDSLASVTADPKINPEALVADPVDLATGDFSFSRSLLKVVAPFPLEFVVNSTSEFDTANRPLGRNCWHNYEVSFNRYSANYVQIRFNRFRYAGFQKNATTGLYESQSPTWARWRVWDGVSGTTYAYDPDTDTKYTFADVARTCTTMEKAGNYADLTYSSVAPVTLTRVTDRATGRYIQLNYAHPTAGYLVTSVTDGVRTASIAYDSNLFAKTLTDAAGQVTTAQNAGNRQVTGLVDGGTNTILTNSYDTAGRVTGQTDGKGKNETFTYNSFVSGIRKSVHTNRVGSADEIYMNAQYRTDHTVDAVSGTTSFFYDTKSNRVKTTDARGNDWKVTLNTANDPVTLTDPLNYTVQTTFDSNGRALSITDQAGNASIFTYGTHGEQLTSADPLGNTTTKTYSGTTGILATITMPRGGVTTFTQSNGVVVSSTDAVGNGESYQWEPNSGLLKKLTNAAGQATQYEHDGNGQTTKITDANGGISLMTYDGRGELATTVDALNGTTSITRDGNGNVLTVTDELGKITTSTYDDEDRPTRVTDPTGVYVGTAYDAAGRKSATWLSGSGTTSFVHDGNGNTTKVTDPTGIITQYQFDKRNAVTKRTDANGNDWLFTYNSRGLMSDTTDPLSQVTTFSYDNDSRMTSVTDPGSLTASRVFDADGNVTSITNPRGKTTHFAFDLADNITSETTHEGHQTLYTYNSLNLPATITDPNLQVTTLGYDNLGLLSTTTDGVGTITNTRDALGQLVSVVEGAKTLGFVRDAAGQVTQYTDSNGYVINYTYDDAGRVKTLTYGGKTVTYSYDSAGRRYQVTDWASRTSTQSYDLASRPTTLVLPNGTTESRSYDTRGLLASLEYTGTASVSLWKSTLTHDVLGRIATDTIVTGGTTSAHSFSYDASGRLASANFPSVATWAPTFDAASNITQLVATDLGGAPLFTGGTYNMSYDADNAVTTLNGNLLLHDNNGNLLYGPLGVAPPFWAFTYDARNRLTDAATTHYDYDAQNHRTKKTESGVTYTEYLYDPVTEQTLMSEDQAGLRNYYVYGDGLQWSVEVTPLGVETVQYYHSDVRGSTVLLTDAAGAVIGGVSYGAWGETLSKDASVTTPFLFCGKYGVMTDPDGLIFMRSRYYHPGLRQFMTRDVLPGNISEGRSLNQFCYANGDPMNLIDPNGTAVTTPQILGAARAVGGVTEAGAGFMFATVTAKTKVGARAGVLITLHGLDQTQAGIREVMTGKYVDSYTSMALQRGGMNKGAAELTDAGISAVGSFGIAGPRILTKWVEIGGIAKAKDLTMGRAIYLDGVGARAFNDADFEALGGFGSSQIQKGIWILEEVDQNLRKYVLTTTPAERAAMARKLWKTGFPFEVDGIMALIGGLFGAPDHYAGARQCSIKR